MAPESVWLDAMLLILLSYYTVSNRIKQENVMKIPKELVLSTELQNQLT